MARRTIYARSHTTKFVLLLVCLWCVFTGSQQQCLTPHDSRPATSAKGHSSFYRGQQNFSLDLLAEINKRSDSKDNVFFSPYSTYHALVMAYFLSSNQTEKALHRALRYGADQDKVDVLQAYKYDKLRGLPYEFSGANRIYTSTELHVRNCMKDLFEDEIETINFKKDPLAAINQINDWVEKQTRGKITDLLPGDAVDEYTSLVLANAAYFKGDWESRFPAEDTHREVFYITPSDTTFVDMMTQEGTFDYESSETLGAHVLRMPYKDGQASMYILLPPFTMKDGLEKVLSNLNANTLHEIVTPEGLMPRTVVVSLPKFSVERTLELAPILEGIGVGDLLRPTSDFSSLTGDPRDRVTLGGAIHKARIDVNEEGTEAAAATAIFTFRSSRPAEPAKFICNHPFIYFIYDSKKKAILFAGIFRRPKNLPPTS